MKKLLVLAIMLFSPLSFSADNFGDYTVLGGSDSDTICLIKIENNRGEFFVKEKCNVSDQHYGARVRLKVANSSTESVQVEVIQEMMFNKAERGFDLISTADRDGNIQLIFARK